MQGSLGNDLRADRSQQFDGMAVVIRSGVTPKYEANVRWNPIATLHRPSA